MAELTFIKQLLSTDIGVEGSLLIPAKIHDMLIPEVEKTLIPRTEAALYYGPESIPGSSVDINLESENIMDVRAISEGGEIYIDQDEYTTVNVRPLKYGVSIRITAELMEDSKFNLMEYNIRKAGKRLAENENSLVIAALDGAANTTAGGASVTIPNITAAMQNVENNDYTPTTFLVGNEVVTDLRNIDTFTEADKIGNTEMLQRGFLGTIYGMNVMRVSTNAGMTATSAYIYDRSEAYCIAEKRPPTVERFRLEVYDMDAVTITHRIAVKLLRSNAVAKITSS